MAKSDSTSSGERPLEDNIEDCITVEVREEDCQSFSRLDQLLANKIDNLSRTFLKKLFERKLVFSEEHLELSKMPPAGTLISVVVPPPLPADVIPENIPLEIIYQDEHLLFVNKEAGMVTHPAPGHGSGTLVNAVMYHCSDLKGVGDKKRPGIVHRLDKGTSGVMVVAKTRECHEGLTLLFGEHKIDRIYDALVMGTDMPVAGTLDSPIGRHSSNRLKMAAGATRGRRAVTHYRVLNFFDRSAHLELRLETGRTHQIRVHLSDLLKSAVVCDPLYGAPKEHLRRLGESAKAILADYPYPLLHARRLGFTHPITGEKMCFEVPLPDIFQKVLAVLCKG